MLDPLSEALGLFAKGEPMPPRDTALATLAAAFRALNLWAHGAHLLAKGTGFAGDHNDLLGPLYLRAGVIFDDVTERALGIGAPDVTAEPTAVTRAALVTMDGWPRVAGDDESALMRATLTVVNAVQGILSAQTAAIVAGGGMTRGLDNLLAQQADDLEGFAYKLGRRVD